MQNTAKCENGAFDKWTIWNSVAKVEQCTAVLETLFTICSKQAWRYNNKKIARSDIAIDRETITWSLIYNLRIGLVTKNGMDVWVHTIFECVAYAILASEKVKPITSKWYLAPSHFNVCRRLFWRCLPPAIAARCLWSRSPYLAPPVQLVFILTG